MAPRMQNGQQFARITVIATPMYSSHIAHQACSETSVEHTIKQGQEQAACSLSLVPLSFPIASFPVNEVPQNVESH